MGWWDTFCYHLIKRPFTSGQVTITTDSKIPLWLLQTTLVPAWCPASSWFPLLVLGTVWASVLMLIPFPTLVSHHHYHPLAFLIVWLACFSNQPSAPSKVSSATHSSSACRTNLVHWVLREIPWVLTKCGFFTLKLCLNQQ